MSVYTLKNKYGWVNELINKFGSKTTNKSASRFRSLIQKNEEEIKSLHKHIDILKSKLKNKCSHPFSFIAVEDVWHEDEFGRWQSRHTTIVKCTYCNNDLHRKEYN